MIRGEHFYYNGVERWSWVFPSPNQFGAFVACILPVVWLVWALATGIAEKRTRITFLLGILLLEGFLWFLLAASASRGAAVAALLGCALWVFQSRYLQARSVWESSVTFASRVLVLLVFYTTTSFSGRIAPGFVASDKSIGNRFVLWKGGAEMVAQAPLTGWGSQEAGGNFVQWYQPLDRSEGYKTMVNAFMEVAVEHGLPAFCLVCLVTWILILCPRAIQREANGGLSKILCAVSSVTAVWAVCNLYSTLIDDWLLWVVPLIATITGVICIVILHKNVVFTTLILPPLIISILLGVGLVCTGLWIHQRPQVQAKRTGDDTIKLRHAGTRQSKTVGVFVDAQTLGRKYGHELRRWAAFHNDDDEWTAIVFDQRRAIDFKKHNSEITYWALFGECARIADKLAEDSVVVFVAPYGTPPLQWAGKGLVILSAIDENGNNSAWTSWAVDHGLTVRSVSDVGNDIRTQWPWKYAQFLSDFEK